MYVEHFYLLLSLLFATDRCTTQLFMIDEPELDAEHQTVDSDAGLIVVDSTKGSDTDEDISDGASASSSSSSQHPPSASTGSLFPLRSSKKRVR